MAPFNLKTIRYGTSLIIILVLILGTGFAMHLNLAGPFSINFLIAKADDPIQGYVDQVNSANLVSVETALVTLYGPRRSDEYSPYIDDKCTLSSVVNPKSNIEMSADYVKSLFLNMGYPASAITLETVPGGYGHNVVVTKVGSTYPNYYIEFGAHMDTVHMAPGGSDNGSGSTAVIELARVLKDYPNRYSMRFALWVSEELGVDVSGSHYHIQQALSRGEVIKAGINMDQIGWADAQSGLMNVVYYSGTESKRIADLFNTVRTAYGIGIGFGESQGLFGSDGEAYDSLGQVAVDSKGGWTSNSPNYHGCGDTVANTNFTNVLLTAKENLAVGLKLDADILGATSTPTFTPTPTIPGSISMGETSILANDDSGNGGVLVAQQAVLSQNATLQSLSFYALGPNGRLRLGIFSDSSGKPLTLLAQTPEFTPTLGWNTQNVVTPTALPAGTYWLAYLAESSSLHFRFAVSGTAKFYSYAYGALPATFSSSAQSGTYHWSFYATLLSGSPTSPTPTLTATTSRTPTTTRTQTVTPTRTITLSPTATPTNTNTTTPTITPTVTLTSIETVYSSPTDTLTPTETPLISPTTPSTVTPTATTTQTQTITTTLTNTVTPPTLSKTPTPTVTRTLTRTTTPTRTRTATATTVRTNTPTQTRTLTITPTATQAGLITAGETTLLSADDYGNGNLLVAQQVTLAQTATLQSLSFYVATATGRLRLAVYTDVAGQPQTLIAQTAEFTLVAGWNTQNVVAPVQLAAGTYWLAYLPESSNLHFRVANTGAARFYDYTYGALPATFSSSPEIGTYHWSFYMTLMISTPTP